MQPKHVLGAVGLTAALAGGGFLGATLGAPSITGAQTDPGTTQEADPGPPDGRGPRFRADLGVAAEALGVTEDELRQALRDGQSMADVAGEQNVEVQTVIDALVADATTRIDEAVADGDLEADRAEELKAELPDRIADVVNGEGFGPGRGGPGGPGRGFRADLGVAAEALGVTEDELRHALRDGQSMADVAGEQNVEVQTVIDALVADATTRIDEAVADGDLEADRAEELKAELPDRIADVVNGEGFGPGRGGPGGPGCDDPAGSEGESEGETPAQSEGSSFTA